MTFYCSYRSKKSNIVQESDHDQLTKQERDDPFFRDAFKDDLYVEEAKVNSKKRAALRLTAEQVSNVTGINILLMPNN